VRRFAQSAGIGIGSIFDFFNRIGQQQTDASQQGGSYSMILSARASRLGWQVNAETFGGLQVDR
jgi:hypothetical protein